VYAGASTRVLVRLDAGADIAALVQNTGEPGGPVLTRGERAEVGFGREHVYRVSTDAAAQEQDPTSDHRVRGAVSQEGHT